MKTDLQVAIKILFRFRKKFCFRSSVEKKVNIVNSNPYKILIHQAPDDNTVHPTKTTKLTCTSQQNGDRCGNMTPLEGSMAAGTPTMEEKCWGPVRRVVVRREKGEPLGIAIVGGKVRLLCRLHSPLQTTSSLDADHSSLYAPH